MKTSNSIIRGLAFKTGVALIALAGTAQMAKADIINDIPYPNIGTLNATTYSFSANGGDVIAYFAGASADDHDVLTLFVNGVSYSGTPSNLDNKSSAFGAYSDFGTFALNTTLVFVLTDISSGNIYYSDPTMNTDKLNHIYSTSYDAAGTPSLGAGIPSGTYVAFEDLLNGGDKDYNDLQFVFQNVSLNPPTVSVPEPTTVVAGALLLLPFGVSTLRILRNRKMAGR